MEEPAPVHRCAVNCGNKVYGLTAAIQEAIFLRQLLDSMGVKQLVPTMIFEDNQACIALSKNGLVNARSKHIDIKYHFNRE